MGKVKIVEDCNAPARFIYLTYTGKNPFGVASKIASMLQPFFNVSSAGISETDFRWDTTGDPTTFYFTWWVERGDLSKYSRQWFIIKVQGSQSKETKEGDFTLQLDARVITEFSFKNPFVKGLFWVYDYIFYNKRRSEYLKECEELMMEFRDEIKKHFNLAVLEKGG